MTSTVRFPSIVLEDGSTLVTILSPQDPSYSPSHPKTPPIICFHGSGPNPTQPWAALLSLLTPHYHILLFDRTATNPSPATHISALHCYLASSHHRRPYILLAHSHGGSFAKQFLAQHPDEVAGVILVETGKAPVPSPATEPERGSGVYDPYGAAVLGSNPLIIIRASLLLLKRNDLEVAEAEASAETAGSATSTSTKERIQRLAQQRIYLEAAEKQDEALERAQLRLSKNSREVYLPDCGHDVIRDRPDAVLEGVEWVIGQIPRHGSEPEGKRTSTNRSSWRRTGLLQRLLCGKEH